MVKSRALPEIFGAPKGHPPPPPVGKYWSKNPSFCLLFHVAHHRWGGLMLHPTACCSAAPPMRCQEQLSPSPMRAAGSGLGLRVGLFNLWAGEQQSAPSVPDGYVVVVMVVIFPSFFYSPSSAPPHTLRSNIKCHERGRELNQRRIAVAADAVACLAIKVAREFVIEHRHCASELSGTVLIVSEQREALPLTSIVFPKRASGAAKG